MTTRTVQIIQDPDDPDQLLLDLGTELCESLGWKPGDRVTWSLRPNGSVSLTKQDLPSDWNEQEEEAWRELEKQTKAQHGSQ